MREIDFLKSKCDQLVSSIEKNKARLKLSPERLDDITKDMIRKEIVEDEERIYTINRQLNMYKIVLNSDPVYSTTGIDLYALSDNKPSENEFSWLYYAACIHGEKTLVGYYGFQNEPGGTHQNNISGFTFEEYRNKGYGYQATIALLEYLHEQGITRAVFKCDKENIPSRKTIEKIKGQYPLLAEKENKYILIYDFDIKTKLDKRDL